MAWTNDLAASCEVVVDVVWRVGTVPHTEWENERATIVLPPSLRSRPEDHWRFTVAHEIGHVVLRDQDVGREVLRRQVSRFGLRLLVIAIVVASVLVWSPSAGVLVSTVGLYAAVLALRPAVRAVQQPGEFAADAFAAHHGGVLTADLAARRAAEERLSGRISRWMYPTHPSWPARGRAVRDAAL